MDIQPTQQNQTPEDYSLSEPRLAGRVEGPKSNKKLINILIAIFLLLAVGAGAYWYFNKSDDRPLYYDYPCPTPPRTCADGTQINYAASNCQQTCPEDATASWQTYRNEEYGFEFKYPKSDKTIDGDFNETKNGEILNIGLYLGKSANFLLDVYPESNKPNIDFTNYKQISINGKSALQFRGNGTANYYFVETYIDTDKYFFAIQFSTPDKETLTNLVDQILSTFKFIK